MRSKHVFHKTTAVVCAAAAAVTVFSACSKTGGSSGSSGTGSVVSGVPSQHTEFSVILPYTNETAGVASGEVFKKLESITNATINIQWTPMASYADKFSVLMNSNNLPDVLLVNDMKVSTYVDAARANQFWQLDSYVKEYSDLKNINATSITNAKTDGKLYVLPRERTLKRQMLVYRTDWLKAAGLSTPDTVEKVYETAKAFAAGDYDGNGKKDTIGLALGTTSQGGGWASIDALTPLLVANGGPNGWGLKNGKVVAQVETSEYVNTIDLLRKMNAEGLISTDFPITLTTKVQSDIIDKEKAGLYLSYSIPGISDPLYLAKKKTNPNLTLSDLYGYVYLKDAKGNDRIPGETGINGGFAFPKSTVKDEAKLKSLLAVMNVIASKEGQLLINDGIEGRQYQMGEAITDKVSSATITNNDLFKSEVSDLNQFGTAGQYTPAVIQDPLQAKLAKDRNTYKDTDLIADVSAPLLSETYSSKFTTLSKAYNEVLYKYILNQVDKNAFQQGIDTYLKNGGTKIDQEFTDSYNKSKK